jgi:hypothetical protein
MFSTSVIQIKIVRMEAKKWCIASPANSYRWIALNQLQDNASETIHPFEAEQTTALVADGKPVTSDPNVAQSENEKRATVMVPVLEEILHNHQERFWGRNG